MAVRLYADKTINTIVSHLDGVNAEVQAVANKGGNAAKARLAGHKRKRIDGTVSGAHIEVEHGEVDSEFMLKGPNAMALEFGHSPSGIFKGTKTKAPEGIYVITRAVDAL